ncbi:MAG: hypothetical protein IH856_04720 [Deltaproteobacteria bacterium]|nr:hypothetical protein [Deltaproteobacteria bacterium]
MWALRQASALILIACLLAPAASVDGIVLAIVTGKEYRQLSSESQNTWFFGVLDGIMAESLDLYGELYRAGVLEDRPVGQDYGTWLGICIERYSVEQFHALFRKKLEAEPKVWHAPAALIARGVIVDFCDPPRKPFLKVSP